MSDPQSEMMRKGWDPRRPGSTRSRAPLFHTSTFVFESSAAAERLFAIVYGGETPEPDEDVGFIYTRMDHPNLVIVESRLSPVGRGRSCASLLQRHLSRVHRPSSPMSDPAA